MKKTLIYIKSKLALLAIIVTATAVGGITTAVVSAAIPDSSGIVHGCYRNSSNLLDVKGALHVIDTNNGETCSAQETALNWSQNGGNFDTTDFSGAYLISANLVYRDFRNLNFSNALMSGGNYSGSDFRGANLTGANLQAAQLSKTKLNGQDLSGYDLSSVFAQNTDFTNITFAGASFTNARLDNQDDFSGDNFTGADFTNAIFSGSDFSDTNLSGVTWSNTYCPDGTNSDNNGNTCVGHLTP